MKAINSKERKIAKVKFAVMYTVTFILIVIILSSFWKAAPPVKPIIIVKEPTEKKDSNNNTEKLVSNEKLNFVIDSMKIIADSYSRKIEILNADLTVQKKAIEQLQTQKTNIKTNNNTNAQLEEINKLNKQIEFYDWALRSQVAVTNTLTKENNRLKSDLSQFKKH